MSNILVSLFGTYLHGSADYTVWDWVNAYSSSNPHMVSNLLIAALTFAVGFAEYFYSTYFCIKHKDGPFPVFMHTFYWAHDFMAGFVFLACDVMVGGFWLFKAAAVAQFVFVGLETFCLHKEVTEQRAQIWGPGATKAQAIESIVVQVVVIFFLVNLFRYFFYDVGMLKWYAFSNILMAIVPGMYWKTKKTRKGTNMGLALVILFGTINTFQPVSLWTNTTDYFTTANNPWFTATGIVAILLAAYGVYNCWKLPKDETVTKTKSPKELPE